MAESLPVRLDMREVWRHALRQSKKPWGAAVLGAVALLGTKALQSVGDPQPFKVWAAIAAAVIGLPAGVVLHFLKHLWLAPLEISAEEKKPLVKAIDDLQAENARLRRRIAQDEISDDETHEKLVSLAETARLLLVDRDQVRYATDRQAWVDRYHDFKKRIDDVMPRLSPLDGLDLRSAWHDPSGKNSLASDMEANVRRTSEKLRALLASYDNRPPERPS